MRVILLDKGAHAVVSDEDYDRIICFRYKVLEDGPRKYAVREAHGKLIGMHQDVLGDKPGLVIDHANRNGLDNTRRNLRYATKSQNRANSRLTKSPNATSQYRGVSATTRFAARIKVNEKIVNLGTFDTEEEAALAYDTAARFHFGEFAELNFPEPGNSAPPTP